MIKIFMNENKKDTHKTDGSCSGKLNFCGFLRCIFIVNKYEYHQKKILIIIVVNYQILAVKNSGTTQQKICNKKL